MKAAIMGYGTIGSGVAKVLETNKDVLAERIGEPLELKYILDLRDFPGDPHEKCFVKDYKEIVKDKEVKIVVETMGGVEPAFTFVKAMLEAGKSVTTSNKALVADKGAELMQIAEKHNVNFVFEAAVGGGIPIIRTLTACLTGDVIEEIDAICNGTTNYMLTNMEQFGSDYAEILAEAQSLGYAEKDPTADVEGFDSCRKIAILTSLVTGKNVDFNDIPTEGISKISATDFKYAKAMGRSIKLIARSVKAGDKYACRVAPYLVKPENMLYHVSGVMNAVSVKGNMLGESMYYGAGAGALPTASAVVGDMVFLAKNIDKYIKLGWTDEKYQLSDPTQEKFRYFVRTTASQSDIENGFENVEYSNLDLDDEVGFITSEMTEREFNERKAALGGIISVIRLA
ncbi:homoserine dehydrogenase [Pseudobutyrivibrio sp. 49]|uniref:homoserine dehydrogenase n=1 Tax=unclassified Pseudobutyrivibrio TaxID=2638619 RepID=UPI000886C9EC|nr:MULTISPECIES: homoserine dehydrogenase [unclassified Pseudobutyrivibrio]SDI25893.1 homoserine dehydrogenase [Pseudobutyrivibrio sp. 49]SFO12804.1 homoserine dehydrogenase [Pseudobutyrivibrio sp. UC1225]